MMAKKLLSSAAVWREMRVNKSELNLDLTLQCGQAFRWHEVRPGVWGCGLAGAVWFLTQTQHSIRYCVVNEDTSNILPIKEEIIDKPLQVDATHTEPLQADATHTEPLQADATHTEPLQADATHTEPKCKHEGNLSDQSNVSNIKVETCNVKKEDSIDPPIIHDTHTDKNLQESFLRDYFQLDVNLSVLYSSWCKVDPVFAGLATAFSGIRMLRQDPTENLFSFICSSNNHISRIASMIDKLCTTYGPRIAQVDGHVYYGFPRVETLAQAGVEDTLRTLGFGYRAKYVSVSAAYVLEQGGSQWLMSLRSREYEESKAQLRKLTGVGAKVADCVCLMSLDQPGAIPVDTHVWQFTARDYMPQLRQCKSVTETVYNNIGVFYRTLWGPYAGWAHSVLFSADLKKFKDKKEQSVGIGAGEGDAKKVKKQQKKSVGSGGGIDTKKVKKQKVKR